jgi:Flp pilus assembly protein TadG
MCRGARGFRAAATSRCHPPRTLLRRFRDARNDHRGQSLVEFALILPILLLLTLIAIDFGRVYLGWINLQNMTRIAADFAANNAAADWSDATVVARYTNQITSDASATNCPLAPNQPAKPTYTDTDNDNKIGIGDKAAVSLVCRFHVITPLISLVVGSDLDVTASSVFPVKSAIVVTSSGGGGGGGCLLPSPAINATPSTSGASPLKVTFRDASGGGAGDSWKWTFAGPEAHPDSTAQDPGEITFTAEGTYTVTLAVTNACGTATTTAGSPGTTITVGPANPPPPQCEVPSLKGVRFNDAQAIWGLPKPPGAGFTTQVQRAAGAPNGNFIIQSQDIVAGNTPVSCDSVIHVNNP